MKKIKKKSGLILYIIIIFINIFLQGCSSNPNADIEDVSLELNVKRLDESMYQAARAFRTSPTPDTFAIYHQYLSPDREFWLELSPFYEQITADSLIRSGFQDTVLALHYGRFLADTNMMKLLDSIHLRFAENYPFEETLLPVFKRVKKHFPDAQIPQIRTFVNGYTPPGVRPEIDQNFPSVSGNYFGMGLHYWLGERFSFYPPDLPMFIRKRFHPRFMVVGVANQIAEDIVPGVDLRKNPTLLDKAIQLGIKQCVLDALAPNEPDSMKFFYTDKQMHWADYYEKNIYKEILPNLYSKDFSVHQGYLVEKPFTADLSRESAPRLAQYFGWKVVKAYLKKHPGTTIAQLSEIRDYESVWKNSGYKP
ncbi:MAG: hypothetical protein K1X92_18770 [Bacteroidia bacterium]|nr:hypothetical protein [Bacteroidia bacterium]